MSRHLRPSRSLPTQGLRVGRGRPRLPPNLPAAAAALPRSLHCCSTHQNPPAAFVWGPQRQGSGGAEISEGCGGPGGCRPQHFPAWLCSAAAARDLPKPRGGELQGSRCPNTSSVASEQKASETLPPP